jgi:serine/threonine kinase 38
MYPLPSNLQIVNWRNYLKFPEEAKLSFEAKDLISRLLCNVEMRIGTKGADEIKVFWCFFSKFYKLFWFTVEH